jgi:hypothetical protein
MKAERNIIALQTRLAKSIVPASRFPKNDCERPGIVALHQNPGADVFPQFFQFAARKTGSPKILFSPGGELFFATPVCKFGA